MIDRKEQRDFFSLDLTTDAELEVKRIQAEDEEEFYVREFNTMTLREFIRIWGKQKQRSIRISAIMYLYYVLYLGTHLVHNYVHIA